MWERSGRARVSLCVCLCLCFSPSGQREAFVAQEVHSFEVELADACLAESENFGDVAHAHAFKVVEGEDLLLALGKEGDFVGDELVEFAVFDEVAAGLLAFVGDGLVEVHLVTAFFRAHATGHSVNL